MHKNLLIYVLVNTDLPKTSGEWPSNNVNIACLGEAVIPRFKCPTSNLSRPQRSPAAISLVADQAPLKTSRLNNEKYRTPCTVTDPRGAQAYQS